MKANLHLLALGMFLSRAGTSLGHPVIDTQPQSSTNDVGTTATFWVAATGTPPLAYQWQKLSGTWSNLAVSSEPARLWVVPPVTRRAVGRLSTCN